MKYILTFIFMLAGLPVLAQSGEAIGQVPIDDSFIDIGPRWEQGQTIHLWVTVFEVEGKFAVCAASQGVTNNRDRQVLEAIILKVNQTIMQRGFRWANNLRGRSRPDGQLATCRLSDMPVVDDPEFDVDISRTRF